jgi:hypothetical protein
MKSNQQVTIAQSEQIDGWSEAIVVSESDFQA